MSPFFLAAVGIVSGLHAYIWLRAVSDTALPPPWSIVASGVIATLYLGMFVLFFARRTLPTGTARAVKLPIYFWMGYALLLVVALAAGDLFLFGWRIAAQPTPVEQLAMVRAVTGGGVALSALAAVYGMLNALAAGRVRLRRLEIALDRLPIAADGLRIVQLSDLHVGPTLRDGWLRRVVERVNALSPDLVVITGDVVDGGVERVRHHARALAGLRARFGVFCCTGNHDHYSGADSWCDELARMSIQPLRNESVLVRSEAGAPLLTVAGVDDLAGRGAGGGPDFAAALGRRDRGCPTLLLSHQPQTVARAAPHGVDLQLSGHTHGGQIWPFHHLVGLQTRYRAGLYDCGATRLFVSRGTGFWGPPIRLLARAEIVEITLRPASS